jgi:transcriptional regulator with XRE-family HTH domain
MNTAKMTQEILDRGWTQTRIGNYCGVTQPTVGRWLTGKDPEGPNRDKLFELYSEVVLGKKSSPFSTFDPDAPDHSGDHDDEAAAFVDGKVVFVGKLPNSQPETSAQGGAGMGQIPDAGEARIQSNGIASGHHVVAEWVIPSPYLRSLGGAPDTTIIVPVYGHSMEPRLYEGDRVIIDVSQNTWVADAIYAIDDGDTNLQIKTIRKVTSSYPPVFRIVSENPPGDEVQRQHDEFRIVGRVVGRISRP